jgi:hypothetical protein
VTRTGRRSAGVPLDVNSDRDPDWLDQDDYGTILRQDAVWAPLPPDLEQRVMRELADRPVGTVVPLPSQRDSVSSPRPDRARWRRPGPRRLALVAAAAAVAGVVAGGALGSTLGRPADPDATLRLAATPLGGAAAADVEVRDTPSGFELKLDLRGLPPAAPGTYYEGWVVGERGAVAIGTFHLREGAQDVVLWSGVDLAAYPRVTVTLQREGGGPASSGQVLLAGEVPETHR